MKKFFIVVFGFFGCFLRAVACEIPMEQNYIHFSLAITYNDIHTVDYLSKKYCFSYFQNNIIGDSPLLQSNDFEQFKSLIKNINSDDLNRKVASGFGENLLISRMLLLTLPKKVRTEMKKEINSIKETYNYTLPLPNLNKNDNDKIIHYLATIYHNSYFNFKDEFGNTPLFYTILTNRPDIVVISLSRSEGKSAFYRPNKDDITPLHLLFSPEVKNYDMKRMNDEILKYIDVQKLFSIEYKGVDYFQFISVMQDNNQDLFNKLHKQFKFDVKLTPSIINVIKNMDLNYIKKVNLLYEKNR